jgi:hypothetical protein
LTNSISVVRVSWKVMVEFLFQIVLHSVR